MKLTSIHIDILPLRPQQIHTESGERNTQTNRTAPPDDRRAHKVILKLSIAPSTHPQPEMQKWPVERFGSKNIFLIWVRHESVVRCHHSHVEVPEISKERGSIEFGIASGY